MARCVHVALTFTLLAGPLMASEFGEARTIDATLPGPAVVRLGDMDGDGDMDVVSGCYAGEQLTLHRNADGAGGVWQGQLVASTPESALSLDLGDLDGDGDLDVVAGTYGSAGGQTGWLLWVENDAGDGSSWTLHVLDSLFDPLQALRVGDLDGDDDLDFVFQIGSIVRWYENVLGDGTSWTWHDLGGPTTHSGSDVDLADVDGDGDLDVLYPTASQAIWLENLAGDGSSWTSHVLGSVSSARGMRAGDLDGDDDLDVLISDSANPQGRLLVYTNLDGVGGSWSLLVIDTQVTYPRDYDLADVDGDGDLDALCVSSQGEVRWNENGNGWAAQTLQPALGAQCDQVLAADLDGDGDTDIVAPAYAQDRVVWWEQLTWFDLGNGLAGALGEPRLDGSGKLLAGAPVLFMLTDALPLSTANLVIGLGELQAPFKGGTLVPTPDLLVPGIPTSFGLVGLPLVWPAGVPPGFATWYQVWIADPGGPAGFSATNAVKAVAP